jgi:hypothetical protein
MLPFQFSDWDILEKCRGMYKCYTGIYVNSLSVIKVFVSTANYMITQCGQINIVF